LNAQPDQASHDTDNLLPNSASEPVASSIHSITTALLLLLLLLQLLAATELQACLAERHTSIALLLVLVLLQAKHSVAAGARSCTASF
jgi:hypothetical protein